MRRVLDCGVHVENPNGFKRRLKDTLIVAARVDIVRRLFEKEPSGITELERVIKVQR